MTVTTVAVPVVSQPPVSARSIPPPRPTGQVWSTTCLSRYEARQLLTEAKEHGNRNAGFGPKGIGLLLDWLDDQPGRTWQDRWLASGAETGDRAWRHIPTGWLTERGHAAKWAHEAFFSTLFTAIAVDLIRPSLPWLVRASFQRGHLMRILAGCRDPGGFSRLRALCSADADISTAAATRTTYRTGLILAAKGGAIADITVGDIVELLEAEAEHCGTKPGATHLFYRILHALCCFGPSAPATLRQLRAVGQRSPDELIDRFQILCRPVRDLLVDYLRERQPALDYASLVSLAGFLGNLFWADLERHHPGISSLHLSAELRRHGNNGYARSPRPLAPPMEQQIRLPLSGSISASASPQCGLSTPNWRTQLLTIPVAGHPGSAPAPSVSRATAPPSFACAANMAPCRFAPGTPT